jgi:hypothetical protein
MVGFSGGYMVSPSLCDSDFIGRVTITIEVSDCNGNKVIEKCSFFFNKIISKIISKKIQELTLNLNADLSLDRIVLDVGMIEYELFEAQMVDKFTSALGKALLVYYEVESKFPLGKTGSYQTRTSERQLMENGVLAQSFPQMSAPPLENRISVTSVQSDSDAVQETAATGVPSLMATVDYYLQQGDWPAPSNQPPRLNSQESPFITPDLWLYIQRQPQQWLPILAKHCLQPLGRRRLKVMLSQAAQKALCRVLIEDNPELSIAIAEQRNPASMVTSAQLSTAAEHYFKKLGVVAKGNPEAEPTQPKWLPQKAPSDLTHGVGKEVSNSILTATLKGNKLLAWPSTKPTVRPVGRDMAPISGKTMSVSNAGCLIFWPLLPTFFSIFGLLEKQMFTSQQARVDAVCLLDWLIWGDDEISDGRLSLNKVICGLPINFEAAWCAPAAEHKVLITEWLEKIREQLPVWKKMGITDIRSLFLQRPGEINWENSGVEIHVTSEAYDALIDNWPWPMNMACFNWLQQPLTIRWL